MPKKKNKTVWWVKWNSKLWKQFILTVWSLGEILTFRMATFQVHPAEGWLDHLIEMLLCKLKKGFANTVNFDHLNFRQNFDIWNNKIPSPPIRRQTRSSYRNAAASVSTGNCDEINQAKRLRLSASK